MTTNKYSDILESPQGATGYQPTPQTVTPNDWESHSMTILTCFKDLFKSNFQLFNPFLVERLAVLSDCKQDITRPHPVKTKSRAHIDNYNIVQSTGCRLDRACIGSQCRVTV